MARQRRRPNQCAPVPIPENQPTVACCFSAPTPGIQDYSRHLLLCPHPGYPVPQPPLASLPPPRLARPTAGLYPFPCFVVMPSPRAPSPGTGLARPNGAGDPGRTADTPASAGGASGSRKRPAPDSPAGGGRSAKKGKSAKKVHWSSAATRQLLDLLAESSEVRTALKSANKNKKLSHIYARWAGMLNNSNSSQAFEGPKVKSKIKKMSSSWRAVHEQVSKLRNRGAATAEVEDKKST